MLTLDFTLVIFTASFILFVIVMKLAFFDPIKKVINAREKSIEENLAESKAALNKLGSSQQSENPATIIRESKLKAQEIVSKVVNESSQERQEMVNRELRDIKANSETSIIELQKEERNILKNLDSYVEELSKNAIDKLMSELGAHATA